MRTRRQSLLNERKGASGVAVVSAACALAAALAAPSSAQAQVIERFALRAELGVGTMFTDYQRNTDAGQYSGNALGYDSLNFHTHLRLAFTLVGPLAIQASFANEFFPTSTRDSGIGRVMAFEGGLRFEPQIKRVGRLFVAGNIGYALTGPYERLEFNGGVGFEFNIVPALALGPVFRVTDVFQPSPSPPRSVQYPYDAVYWSAGVSLTARVPPEREIIDTDCDTVIDPEDVCPTVPQGARHDPRRAGCPVPDSDGDFVVDPDDVCPAIPEGDFPDVGRMGCPDPDNDHDAVLNAEDRCPNLPKGDIPDPQRPGCPHPNPQAVLTAGRIEIRRQIRFDTDQALIDLTRSPDAQRLTTENHEVLDQVVQILQGHVELRIDVRGFTDNQCSGCQEGHYRHNLELSRRRAAAIQEYLVSHGIAANRIESHGRGEANPIGDNNTEEGRQLNRRVEFHVMNPAVEPPRTVEEVRPHRRSPPPPPTLPSRPCVVRTRG